MAGQTLGLFFWIFFFLKKIFFNIFLTFLKKIFFNFSKKFFGKIWTWTWGEKKLNLNLKGLKDYDVLGGVIMCLYTTYDLLYQILPHFVRSATQHKYMLKTWLTPCWNQNVLPCVIGYFIFLYFENPRANWAECGPRFLMFNNGIFTSNLAAVIWYHIFCTSLFSIYTG